MDRGVGRRRGRVPETQWLIQSGKARHRTRCRAAYSFLHQSDGMLARRLTMWSQTRRKWPKPGADGLLSLAAAPAFAIMALLTAIQGVGMPDMLCSAAHGSSLTGMVP